MNQPPEHCPYCGGDVEPLEAPPGERSTIETVGTPSVFRCEACDDYVFYNPAPGGSPSSSTATASS